jgi:hypothetical protein
MNIPQIPHDPKSLFIIVASTIGFAAGIYLLWDYLSFTLMADETQGQIVATDDHYYTILYNVEGQTFRIKDPLSPDNARVSNYNWFYPFIWIALPLLFLLSVLYPKILGRGTDEET